MTNGHRLERAQAGLGLTVIGRVRRAGRQTTGSHRQCKTILRLHGKLLSFEPELVGLETRGPKQKPKTHAACGYGPRADKGQTGTARDATITIPLFARPEARWPLPRDGSRCGRTSDRSTPSSGRLLSETEDPGPFRARNHASNIPEGRGDARGQPMKSERLAESKKRGKSG